LSENGSEPRLIGGLYGVSIGRMFFGESMFTRERDASKLALLCLVNLLRELDFHVIDCQQNTRHLASLGAREVPRSVFLKQLSELARLPDPDWSSVRIEVSGA
jgi:leucyl/phenylalanyl-tRNA--protein transferase